MSTVEQDGTESDLPPVPFWSTLYGFVLPYRKPILISTVCAMFVGITAAMQPLCIKFIIDNGILRKTDGGDAFAPPEERMHYALLFVGLYVALSASRMIVGVSGVRFMIDGIEGVLCDLRERFFRHVQELCLRFHDEVSSGELFNYIMGSPLQSLKMFLHQGSLTIPIMVVQWVVAAGTLAYFDWRMTLITLAIIGAIVFVNMRSKTVIREVASTFMRTESTASKYIADMLRGSRAVKLYAIESEVTSSFTHHIISIRTEGINLAWRRTVEGSKVESLRYVGMALIYAAGAYFCLYGEMKVGVLFAFITSINLLMNPLLQLMQLNLIRANAEAGLERIVRILEREKTTPELPEGKRTGVQSQVLRAKDKQADVPCVEFRDVDFSYRDEKAIFDKFNITISDGQSVALVGPSGSGKSTFVSLLLRLYDPQAGTILMNGRDLQEYSLQDLRASFGVVPQDPFMFQGTILDNIRVTRKDASQDEIRHAIETAFVDEFMNELPEGEQTVVGEGGSLLSGGQRQRIAIARAVLSNARYYIFDEATSALDNQSEKRIQQAMETLMRNRTSFVIAHRLSTIRNVDRILVFDKGRVVQDGTYDELAAQHGMFRELLAEANDG